MRLKTIAAAAGMLAVACLAHADSIHEYSLSKAVKLKAGSYETVQMPCSGYDAAFRGGAYITKAGGKIAAYNNPVTQQVPIYDADQDKVTGLQFGLVNSAGTAKDVTVWISCISDNNG